MINFCGVYEAGDNYSPMQVDRPEGFLDNSLGNS